MITIDNKNYSNSDSNCSAAGVLPPSSLYYLLTEQGVDEVKAVASFFYDVFLYKYPLVACDSLRATQVIAIGMPTSFLRHSSPFITLHCMHFCYRSTTCA